MLKNFIKPLRNIHIQNQFLRITINKVKQSLLLDVPTLENILICAHPNKVKQSLLLDVPTPKCHGEEGSSGQHAWKHQTQVKKNHYIKLK